MSSAVMGLLASATVASPTYTLTQSATSINEGDTVTFSIQLTNVASGTLFYWNYGGTAVQDDFTAGGLTGYFYSTGSSNADVFLSLTAKKDFNLAAEGTETFYIRLLDSSNSVVLKTSQTISINDTANLSSSSGQVEFTTPGTYTFIPGVTTTYCLLAVGGGGAGAGGGDAPGGGAGGGLAYVNGYSLTSGSSYTVVVGEGGNDGGYPGGGNGGTSATGTNVAGVVGKQSYVVSTTVCRAGYGNGGPTTNGGSGSAVAGAVSGGASRAAFSGGSGGIASTADTATDDGVRDSGPGGGAGGYAGAGGPGGASSAVTSGAGGTGGSGAAGYAGSDGPAGGGGGVGIYGQGANGVRGTYSIYYNLYSQGGGGGSGGGDGGAGDAFGGPGGGYGGGGGGGEFWDGVGYGAGGGGGGGACRIIWGSGRAYPSTNTADV